MIPALDCFTLTINSHNQLNHDCYAQLLKPVGVFFIWTRSIYFLFTQCRYFSPQSLPNNVVTLQASISNSTKPATENYFCVSAPCLANTSAFHLCPKTTFINFSTTKSQFDRIVGKFVDKLILAIKVRVANIKLKVCSIIIACDKHWRAHDRQNISNNSSIV